MKGTLSGSDFVCKTTLASTLYADYDYKLTLRNRGGEVTAVLSPDFSGAAEVDAIQITGEWLSDKNTVTLPFTPEPNYGFTIGYILNVDGSARDRDHIGRLVRRRHRQGGCPSVSAR